MSTPRTLWQVLGQVPEPRQASGQRYALESLLALTVIAMLAGARSLDAVAQFGRDYRQVIGPALGFDSHKAMPFVVTLWWLELLYQGIQVRALETALRRWLEDRAQGDAEFCQRHIRAKGSSKRGDYLWPMKDNQKRLKQMILRRLAPAMLR